MKTNNSTEEYNSSLKNIKLNVENFIGTEGKNPSQIPIKEAPITKPGILSSILNSIFKDKETSNK